MTTGPPACLVGRLELDPWCRGHRHPAGRQFSGVHATGLEPREALDLGHYDP